MAKFTILGVHGETGFWLVDFEKGSVTAMSDMTTEPFGYTAGARGKGEVLTAATDLAVTVTDRAEAFAGRYDSVAFAARYD